MNIYTKGGDKGKTSLIGGKRVEKSHPRLEAYGSIDELTANIGVLYDSMPFDDYKKPLCRIMNSLMVCSSLLAVEGEVAKKLPVIENSEITWLENEIDTMQKGLEPSEYFVLPCGHPSVSAAHVARTVCRRSERTVVRLSETCVVADNVQPYLNRLSDYLFVISRRIAFILKIDEIHWIPGCS